MATVLGRAVRSFALRSRGYSVGSRASSARSGVFRRFSSSADSVIEGKEVQMRVESKLVSSPRHDMALLFTCTHCETRSFKTMSRETYENGVVITQCGGCQRRHLIADRLGWFGAKGSVEDFLAEKGIDVKKATGETYEFRIEDFVAKKTETAAK